MSWVIDFNRLSAKHKSGKLRCPATALISDFSFSDLQHTIVYESVNMGSALSLLPYNIIWIAFRITSREVRLNQNRDMVNR